MNYLTFDEMAKRLGLSVRSMYYYKHSPGFPPVLEVGRNLRVLEDDFLKWQSTLAREQDSIKYSPKTEKSIHKGQSDFLAPILSFVDGVEIMRPYAFGILKNMYSDEVYSLIEDLKLPYIWDGTRHFIIADLRREPGQGGKWTPPDVYGDYLGRFSPKWI